MNPDRICKKYEVGVKRFSMVDEDRAESLGIANDSQSEGITPANGYRKMSVELFYPVARENVEGLVKSQYVSDVKAAAIGKAFHIPKSAMAHNEIDAYVDAPLLSERFPLLLFSHGYGSFQEANSHLCMEIAANGYFVASIGHAYEAVVNEYDDGSANYMDETIKKRMYAKGVWKALKAQKKIIKCQGTIEEIDELFRTFKNEHTPFLNERVKVWAQDTICVINRLKEDFSNHIDFAGGVAVSGHSLGGATAFYLSQTCDDICCGLNIDGALFGSDDNAVLKKPFYQIACRENFNVEQSMLLRREVPVYTAVFDGMKHLGFTDIKFNISIGALVGKMKSEVMHTHLVECHMYMLDKYLKGKDINLNESHDDGVTITAYE